MGHHQTKPKKNLKPESNKQPGSAGEAGAGGDNGPDSGAAGNVTENLAGGDDANRNTNHSGKKGKFQRNVKVTPVKVKDGGNEIGKAKTSFMFHGKATEKRGEETTDSFDILEVELSTLDHRKNGKIVPVPLPEHNLEEGFISVSQLFNSMSDGQVRSYLSDPLFLLLLDARGASHYEKEHITAAYHHTALERSALLQPITEYTLVVAYDDDGLTLSLTGSTLSRVHEKIRSRGVDIFVLTGGFKAFKACHPYLVSNQVPMTDREKQNLITTYPSIILDGQLYQGRCDQALDKTLLDNLQITHIVNITVNRPCPFTDTIQYLNILLEDEFKSDLLAAFPNVIRFIRKALKAKGRVLVHCKLGVSRSSTVVLAYLMHEYHWSFKDAFHFLKERRPVVRPNRGFIKQLLLFEYMLFGCKSADIDELFY